MSLNAVKRIAFILDEFALQSPGQQLLDRFLAGYAHEGSFHKPPFQIAIYTASHERGQSDIDARQKRFGLLPTFSSLPDALQDAQAIVIAGPRASSPSGLIRQAVETARAGSRCFVYGALGATAAEAQALTASARQRNLALSAGTALPWCWPLPELSLPPRVTLSEALIVVQGDGLEPVLHGLEVLSPSLEARRGGETGLRQVQFLANADLWTAQARKQWSTDLLAAAISRSNTPQGDPLTDGRTQDLVGLGLVPKLAEAPRGWLLEHLDGLHSAILLLNGVVRDCNFALRARGGKIWSAQNYRPPLPEAPEFSRLAASLEAFFLTGKLPSPPGRPLFISGALESCARALSRPNEWVKATSTAER